MMSKPVSPARALTGHGEFARLLWNGIDEFQHTTELAVFIVEALGEFGFGQYAVDQVRNFTLSRPLEDPPAALGEEINRALLDGFDEFHATTAAWEMTR